MKKRYLKIFIAFLIVAVVTVGILIGAMISKKKKEEAREAELHKNEIFVFDPSHADEIFVKNSEGDFSFKFDNVEQLWVSLDDSFSSVNPDKIHSIIYKMAELQSESILVEDANDSEMAKYGLDDPSVITVKLDNSKKYSIEFGDQVPGKTKYYARVSGKNSVYIIDTFYADDIIADRNELIDPYIINVSVNAITGIKYLENGKTVYDISKDKNDEWHITEPFPQGTVAVTKLNTLFDNLTRAASEAVVEEGKIDLSKYGFDKPSYEVIIESGVKKVDFIFGDYAEFPSGDAGVSYIYGMKKGGDQVLIFAVPAIACIGTSLDDIVFTKLHESYLGDLDGFTGNIFGTEFKFDYHYDPTHETENVFVLDGVQIDQANDEQTAASAELANSMLGFCFEKLCLEPDKEYLKHKPDAEFTVFKHNGETYKLEFIQTPEDENLFYIIENGEYINCLARRKSLESGVLKSYNALKKILEKSGE